MKQYHVKIKYVIITIIVNKDLSPNPRNASN